MNSTTFTLYAMKASLFSAKVRAWLCYNNVNFIEKGPGQPEYMQDIMPHIGRWIVPVLKTPTNEILQDGTDILDWLDTNMPHGGSIYPENPVIRTIAHLFELFGGEGLLRPAMHYRWNFDGQNLAFIKLSFKDILPSGLSDEQFEILFEKQAASRMRKAAQYFGVNDASIPMIEQSYFEFLKLLDLHLSRYPFLLGGSPTIGDFAMYGPLYAHLGRDPYPLALMQQQAPNVFQWIERMSAPQPIENEIYLNAKGKLFTVEELPDTLIDLMKYISAEYLPEISAHVNFANQWLAEHPNIASGETGVEKPKPQTAIGVAEFDWYGQRLSSSVLIYRFYLLQRLTDHFNDLNESNRQQTTQLFTTAGLDSILQLKTHRRVIRQNQKEVWQ